MLARCSVPHFPIRARLCPGWGTAFPALDMVRLCDSYDLTPGFLAVCLSRGCQPPSEALHSALPEHWRCAPASMGGLVLSLDSQTGGASMFVALGCCCSHQLLSTSFRPVLWSLAGQAKMEATLEYLVDDPRWEKEKPYRLFVKTDSTIPQTNCQFEAGKARVQDVRQLDRHMQPSFEMDGFELLHSPLPGLHAADFEDPQKEESVAVPYLQTTMTLLKNRLSAEHIVCIDWRVRAGHLVHSLSLSSIPSPRAAVVDRRADSNRYLSSSEPKGERKRTFETSTTWPMCATKLCSLRDMPTPVLDIHLYHGPAGTLRILTQAIVS